MVQLDKGARSTATRPGGFLSSPAIANLIGVVSRFSIAGLINTALGFAVIAALDVGFGVDPHVANACGYAVGIAVSFILNKNFVFKSGRSGAIQRFVVSTAAAFLANQLVLTVASAVLGAHPIARSLSQLMGMATYTITQFAICYVWVFSDGDQGKHRSEQ